MKTHRVIQLALVVLVGLWAGASKGIGDRGLKFTHEGHSKHMRMGCTDCHGMDPAERSMPNHQLCSICHETDKDAEDVLECSHCHTRKENEVDALARHLAGKVTFRHEPHREQKCTDCHYNGEELKNRMPDDPDSTGPPMPTCGLCHPDPDAGRFAATPAMPFCIECHVKMGESRTRCAVCHDEVPVHSTDQTAVRNGSRHL